MPVTTQTYGVFSTLYNGGGDTAFSGLYANGAIGKVYSVVGIVSALDQTVDTKTTANNPISSVALYAFQTQFKVTANNPTSSVLATFSAVSSKSHNLYKEQVASLLLAQGSASSKSTNKTGLEATYFITDGVKSQGKIRSALAAEIESQSSSRSQTRSDAGATALVERTTSSKSSSLFGVSSISLIQATTSLRTRGVSKLASTAEILTQIAVPNKTLIRSGATSQKEAVSSTKSQGKASTSAVSLSLIHI